MPADYAQIKLLVLDVDGILTDGGLYFDEGGQHFKRFDMRDGMGLQLLRKGGVEIAVISGHASKATEARLERLQITRRVTGVRNKLEAFEQLLLETELPREAVAAMGDDWNDLSMMREAGVAFTVPEAPIEIRNLAHYITERSGGRGAVREVCELILRSSGRFDAALEALNP